MPSTIASQARHGRPSTRLVVAVVAAVALAAAAAGFLAGRATRSGAPAVSPIGRWQTLPPAPVAGRIAEAAVWTGRELIVAGGLVRNRDGTTVRVSDGAAYDPARRTWRRIAAAPAGVGAGAVWTGSRLVAWTGNGPDGPAVGAVYDPRLDTWRRLPTGPLGPREGNADVWTGTELLVIGGHAGDGFATPVAAAVDPATGAWRPLHGLYGLTLVGGPNGAVWDGREAIVAGNLSLCPERGTTCGRRRPIVVAYDPRADTMHELKLPAYSAAFGADTAASLTPIALVGREVAFRASAPGSLRILTYDTASGAWRIGPAAPCLLPHGGDTQVVPIGERVVAPCAGDGLQIYDTSGRAWRWRGLTPGASPLDSRAGSATAWTGTELIVWSGRAFERRNPTPAGGASLTLPR